MSLHDDLMPDDVSDAETYMWDERYADAVSDLLHDTRWCDEHQMGVDECRCDLDAESYGFDDDYAVVAEQDRMAFIYSDEDAEVAAQAEQEYWENDPEYRALYFREQ